MKDIGLVFSGGGGKGAYQIGVWQALREMKLDKRVAVVSGTSVGALNAALFLKGNLELAVDIWRSISPESLLSPERKRNDALFSNKGLHVLLKIALSEPDPEDPVLCYAACKRLNDGMVKYFELSNIIDPVYREKILTASSAIPLAYPPVIIDGENYIDGGANGDNTPVDPVYRNGIPFIIVVHLSKDDPPCRGKWHGSDVYDLYPSISLGDFIDGTLDFNAKRAEERRKLGYSDGLVFLKKITHLFKDVYIQKVLNVVSEAESTINMDESEEIKIDDSYMHTADSKEEDTYNMDKIVFEQDSVQEQFEKRVEDLRRIALSPDLTTRVMWDATVAKYADTVRRIQILAEQDELRDEISPRLLSHMDSFLAKCEKQEFHIALVGTIKAGKSTLINALLDDDLASTDVTPETAALTKFRGGQVDSVSVYFYSKNEWNELWQSAVESDNSKFMKEYNALDADKEKPEWVDHKSVHIEFGSRSELKEEIRKWTSSRSARHYFVKEVEVCLSGLTLPEGVVLVDTPGLNDAVEYRSNITKDYIDRANAVFVCVKADKLTAAELTTIYGVFSNARYNTEKIYIIGTQQDTLNDPIEDWKKQRNSWLDYLKERACYNNPEMAERNLLCTSGYLYTLLTNHKLLDHTRKKQLYSAAFKLDCMPEDTR